MPREMKPGPETHAAPSSFFSLVSGWAQQGLESLFATQRILVDLAMRQNATAMKTLRAGLTDPENSPMALFTELGVEATSNFIEAQRILLNLAQHENEIVTNGFKERVGSSTAAMAMTDMVRRGIDNFIDMQQEFLTLASKHAMNWMEAAKHGKMYDGGKLVELAREGMDHFVRAQKKFLDVIAEETTRATSGKEDHPKKMKKTEMTELAREATGAFIDAQKKLLDLAGQQMNVNLKTASRAMEMMSPGRLMPMATLTGEGVKNFVEAEKAMIDNMVKPRAPKARKVTPPPKRKGRKVPAVQVAGAGV